MFRLNLSKLIRKMNNIDIPEKCQAYRFIPESLNDICDCKDECKYNGGGGIMINTREFPPLTPLYRFGSTRGKIPLKVD